MTTETTTRYLRYTGDFALVEQAEAALRAAVPSELLVRKAMGVYAMTLPTGATLLLQLPENWVVYEPTYADTNPPGISLDGLRQRLAELRTVHDTDD